MNYIEPVNSKSNLRWVIGKKEKGKEKRYLGVIKGKWAFLLLCNFQLKKKKKPDMEKTVEEEDNYIT